MKRTIQKNENKLIRLCEASSNGRFCYNEARFKIIDIECKPINNSFWVCNNCIRFFINQKGDNPHYIILQEIKQNENI